MNTQRKQQPKLYSDMKIFLLNNKALLILIVLFIIASFGNEVFLTSTNLRNVVRQVAVSTVLGMGFTLVIASGTMDLSVGTMLGLIGVIMAKVSLIDGVPLWVALAVGVLCGALFGMINGFISVRYSLNPFIVTLSTQQIFKGACYLLCNNSPISSISDGFKAIGQGAVGSVPVPIIIVVVVAIVISTIFYKMEFGRHIVAMGGNSEAARVSGIDVNKVRVAVYTLMGVCVAIAAMIMTGRVASAQPTAGQGMEMDAICSVVLGGTTLGGGKGKVGGTILGCLIVGVINNCLNLLRIDSNWQLIAKGVLILFAVILDIKTERLIRKSQQ